MTWLSRFAHSMSHHDPGQLLVNCVTSPWEEGRSVDVEMTDSAWSTRASRRGDIDTATG